MWWIIGIIALAILGFIVETKKKEEKKKESENDLKVKLGQSYEKLITSGTYLGGHPDIDNIQFRTRLLPFNKEIEILVAEKDTEGHEISTSKKASIPCDCINQILVQDASTITQTVSLSKMALFGPFAFAMKNQKKKECAYLIIDWNDGRFEHKTLFEYNHTGAMTTANTARNNLIKELRGTE